jgi:hypothetical protein
MSTLKKLTENIVAQNLRNETKPLIEKWTRTGLLEGLSDQSKSVMSRLLENQAKELLREATTMEAGDVEGFAAVAFPIVRRVFSGLLAQDLVSVQPMSLPSGLVFFMDFVYHNTRGPFTADTSLYGGGKVAKGIADGVSIASGSEETGFYNLNSGYSVATGSEIVASASFTTVAIVATSTGSTHITDANAALIRFDPDLIANGDSALSAGDTRYVHIYRCNPSSSLATQLSKHHLMALNATGFSHTGDHLVRRLTTTGSTGLVLYVESQVAASPISSSGCTPITITFPITDNLVAGGALGAVVGSTAWSLEAEKQIPEINIKIDSIAITAQTRKLKSVWTPELAQDMNAYHSMDAEVELTGILSESIALEVDQEILHDLIRGATAATLYWSRRPGLFVNRLTGADITSNGANLPDFTGNVSMWYETLLETINDVSADIHRKVRKGGATFIVTGPELANVLEFTSGFRADVTGDAETGTAGTYKTGSINKKWDIYVAPDFPRNVILVGRKGKSFLESGFVYAPYVPLQVTPTIWDPEDFTPRKGVATRYGKKMVRPDMYGLVIVRDLEG